MIVLHAVIDRGVGSDRTPSSARSRRNCDGISPRNQLGCFGQALKAGSVQVKCPWADRVDGLRVTFRSSSV